MKLIYVVWLIFLFFLPLGSLSRLPIGDVAFTVNDVILPVMIGLWLLYILVIQKRVVLPPRTMLIVGFAFWAFITLLFSLRFLGMAQFLISGLYWVRWVEYAFVFFIGYWLFTQGEEAKATMRATVKMLLWGQLMFVLAGFLQFALFPNFSKFVQHGWDPHYYRLLSTFLDPNFAGIFIVLGMVLFGAFFLLKEETILPTKTSKSVSYVYVLLALVAVVLTFSRSSYLGFAVAVGCIGLLKSRAVLFVMAFVGIASFVFIPRVQTRVIGAFSFDETVMARLSQYELTLGIIEKDPVFGVGFNTFRYAQEDAGYFRDDRGVSFEGGHAGAGSDSSLLFILVTTGVPGLLLYLAMWGAFLKDAFRAYITRSNTTLVRALGLVIVVSQLALMAHTQFVNSMFYPWIMAWMWILLALMYASRANNEVKHTI